MEEPGDRPPGPFASLKRLGRAVLGTAQNRLELLLVELEEERQRAVEALLLTMAVAVLAFMALSAGTLALVLLFGEEHRPAVLGVLGLFYLLAAFAIWWRLRARLKTWQSFSATLEELKKDKEWLENRK